MAQMTRCTRWDWCHVCGKRSEQNAEIRYPANAEHEARPLVSFIRICAACARQAAGVASGPYTPPVPNPPCPVVPQ